jgi:Uma2 family endonuclease
MTMTTKPGTVVGPVEEAAGRGSVTFVTNGGTPFAVPPEAHNHDGFRRWVTGPDFPDHVRVFFDQGEMWFDMSKEELETHNKVKVEIARALAGLVQDNDLGEFYGDGALVSNEAAGVSNNPDALFVCWDSFDAERVHLVQRDNAPGQYLEIEGIPDWVLEMVSRSSVKKDTEKLLQAYHRAGIPEYWLLDARGERVNFQILQHRKSRYFATKRKDGYQWSNVFARWFRLERSRGRRDLWRYRLQVRDA